MARTKSIAPRLMSRDSRNQKTSRFPPDVDKILKIMARDEKCSVNWVVEQIVVTYLNLDIDYQVKVTRRK